MLIILLTGWIAGIMLAPILASSHVFWLNRLGRLIYYIYQPACHQFPERSFFISNFPFTVCVRCFAIYVCGLVAAIYYLFHISITMLKLSTYGIITVFPVIDFLLEKLNIYHDIIILRFFTGILLGFVIFHLLIVGISDIQK